jgi:8-oxo-dGTP pyrophosphatase MutT (NUDIX family)
MAKKKSKAEREVSAGGIVFRRQPDRSARFLLIRDPYEHWGFPKGHLEGEETPADAALREAAEETGLTDLRLHGPIRIIDWHFRFRGRYIHKFCHFFLLESPVAEVIPQVDEGITDYRWLTLEEALDALSYDNARGVLKRAGEMARTLVAVGVGRPGRHKHHAAAGDIALAPSAPSTSAPGGAEGEAPTASALSETPEA